MAGSGGMYLSSQLVIPGMILGQDSQYISMIPYLENSKRKKGWECVVEGLPSKFEALSSNNSTEKNHGSGTQGHCQH
jgi:hypothetical protein